ncbi:MAG: hypothetical protein EOP90_08865 [Lysobacteraceae bacterium]|nr:MAG: hypothetical protein EOP90_08865 [Xanthomonadaceae bacterium]
MSLPLPVFRLESQRDLPFEPLCALSATPALTRDEVAGSLIERFRLWLAGHGTPTRSPGVG